MVCYCRQCLVTKLIEIVYQINAGYCQQYLVKKLLEIVYQINTVEDVDAGGQDAAATDTGASAGSQSFIFLHSKNISVVTQTTSERDVTEDGETTSENRTVDSRPSWCVCDNCREMPTPVEKRCCRRKPAGCRSIEVLNDIIRNVKKSPRYPEVKSKQEEHFINDKKRRKCYRKLAEKIHGKLGAKNRKPLPACCVWKIRDQFPDPFGKYQGFRKAK